MSYAHNLGETMGAVSATFAGFSPQNISAYFGNLGIANAQLLIRLANGGKVQTQAEADLIAKWDTPQRSAKGAVIMRNSPLGQFPTMWKELLGGLKHLAAHPKGSKVSGGFMKTLTNVALNFATGGLYSIGKAALNVAKGGKVMPNLKTAIASYGTAGSILQPTIGTNKTLAIEAAIMTAGAGSAIASGAIAGPGTSLLPTAMKVGTGLITASPPSSVTYPPSGPLPSGPQPGQPGYDEQGFGPGYAEQGFGPPVAQAGMFGGLSPLALVALFGVPLVIQMFTRGKSAPKGKRS